MKMLPALQQDFQEHLLRGSDAVRVHVVGSERFPVETRLGIYAHAYTGRLAEALQSNFPALAALLGESDFAALAHSYITANPSRHFSIRWYGEQLPPWLAKHPDYRDAPLLAELAQWEWATGLAFDAADATALTHADLAGIPQSQWPQLRLRWHPAVQRLDLRWNVPAIWQALTGEGERPEAQLQPRATPWLIWRDGLVTFYRSLSTVEAGAVDGARAGWPFAEVCEHLCAHVPAADAAAQAAGLLRGWVQSGLIVGVSSQTTAPPA
ncbi:MAG: putative DNA-binding domain-containing protein [Proteobacteria bacterium]|nr:putative DNA-binding domain-containing protein [Pseudomonadota bacterium]